MRLKQVPYIPIRNDAAARSLLSNNEANFVRHALNDAELRVDGRSLWQLRPSRIQLTRSALTGDTGCTVTWGGGSGLQVHCTTSSQIVPPSSSDRPNEGMIQIFVDLSPMASSAFKWGPAVSNASGGFGSKSGGSAPLEDAQKLQANQILRQLENLITTGNCLDNEALVIVPGQWVWQLQIRVTVWDCVGGGHANVVDAAILAVMAALRHYRQPATKLPSSSSSLSYSSSIPQTISLDEKEGTPLPLHHTPLSMTFAWLVKDNNRESGTGSPLDPMLPMDTRLGGIENDLLDDNIVLFVDPSWQEQVVAEGNQVTMCLNRHGEVCGVTATGVGVTPRLLRVCYQHAMQLLPQLLTSLETTLQQAHSQAVQEGLERMHLQQQQQQANAATVTGGEQDMDVDESVTPDIHQEKSLLQAAQESYRKQALEYNLGHQAVSIRNDDDKKKKASNQSSRLLQSLLQAVSKQQQQQQEVTKQSQLSNDDSEKLEEEPPKDTKTSAPTSKPTLDSSGLTVLKLTMPENADHVVVDESTVPKRPASAAVAVPAATDGVLDSDEEEETMQLTGEFQQPRQPNIDEDEDEQEEEEEDEYKAALAYNKALKEQEEEDAYWEEQRNTNQDETAAGNKSAGWGPDKIKGGRIPRAAGTPAESTDNDSKPSRSQARRKQRQMANRRDQQKKAMQKKSGAG